MKAVAPTPLLAAASLVGAAPAVAAPVAGSTSQHAGRYGSQRLPSNAVSFLFARGKVSRFSIPWVATCANADVKAAQEPLLDRMLISDPLALRKGRFEARGTYGFPPGIGQSAGVDFVLRGSVQGRRASGTLSVTADISLSGRVSVGECATRHTIRWQAVTARRARSAAAPRARTPAAAVHGAARLRAQRRRRRDVRSVVDRSGRRSPAGAAFTQPPAGAADAAPTMEQAPVRDDLPAHVRRRQAELYVTDPEGFGNDFGTALGQGRITDFAQGASDPATFRAP